MSRDYNIYIDDRTSAKGSNTAPGNNTTIVNSSNISVQFIFNQIKNAPIKTIGSINKLIPFTASFLGSGHVVDSAVSLLGYYNEAHNGNANVRMNYANFKTALGSITNPLSTIKQVAIGNMQESIFERKLQEQRKLTGNTIITPYDRKAS